ncbi:transglutaminase-like domain-containing protein [Oscillatoria sp. FACHB-1406]|uniref:SirB1 family protein n=1 Tax=Oscillatoria sp. FACHB-1406 TaxID=2692846 RepID=UPI001688F654|nr:transglutaminase-like domain-containing protein [Oscillatoria sp. FACHB-1406]MBD2578402.1 tetratricopeptide repeat protein [Oscillatoria sp. FACHB-1406]
MSHYSARQNFYREINCPDEQIYLAKAALYIAREEYPELEVSKYLNMLDRIAEEIEILLPEKRYPLKTIETINQFLYDNLGFKGNKQDYYNPCNSFLNDVLDRRTGIPIALSLVYLEIAKRLNFPMVGIGLPGHFLIRPTFEGVGIFVDPFNGGEILFEQDCEALLSKLYQQNVQLESNFLAPVTNRQFLARMLSNLKFIYLNQHQLQKALATIERILLLFPTAASELRDRGLLFYQLGEKSKAKQDLEFYLAMAPQATDVDAIRQFLAQMG